MYVIFFLSFFPLSQDSQASNNSKKRFSRKVSAPGERPDVISVFLNK